MLMLRRIGRWSRALLNRGAREPRALVEACEPRRLLAATVTGEIILGPSTRPTALVIRFSESMDPVTAQDPENYDFRGALGLVRPRFRKIDFLTPVYNDADHTVTIPIKKKFNITKWRRLRIRVAGDDGQGVTNALGDLLDGDHDGIAGGQYERKILVKKDRGYTFREADGDQVVLRSRNAAGKAFIALIGPEEHAGQVWVVKKNATLEGEVNADGGDGATSIGRIVLEKEATSNALGSPLPFNVGQVVTDPLAPADAAALDGSLPALA